MTCDNASIWLSLTYLEWAALARNGFIRVQGHRVVPVCVPVDISDFQQVMAAAPSLGLDSGGYVVAVLKSPLLERWSGDCADREVLDVSSIDRFIVMDDVSKRMLVNGQEEFNGFRYETLMDGVWSSWVDAEKKRLAGYRVSLGLRLFGYDDFKGWIFCFSMSDKDRLIKSIGTCHGGWAFAISDELSECRVVRGDLDFLSVFFEKNKVERSGFVRKGDRFFGGYGRDVVRCLDDSSVDGVDGVDWNSLISRALFNHYLLMINRRASDFDVSSLRDDVVFLSRRSELEARRFLASLFSYIDDEVVGAIRRGIERMPVLSVDQGAIGSDGATSIVEVGGESTEEPVSTLKSVDQSAGEQEDSDQAAVEQAAAGQAAAGQEAAGQEAAGQEAAEQAAVEQAAGDQTPVEQPETDQASSEQSVKKRSPNGKPSESKRKENAPGTTSGHKKTGKNKDQENKPEISRVSKKTQGPQLF